MKKVKMFMFGSCPHCRLAINLLEQLQQNAPYDQVEIEMINEREQPELADQYDYYYVPSFFIGEQKVHEGHAEMEDVKRVLDLALEAN